MTRQYGDRRQFLRTTAIGGTMAGTATWSFLDQLSPLQAAETVVDDQTVRFSDEIEPMVRLLEETPRDQVVEEVARRIKTGALSYRELLAALLLAAVRNVEPRPSVGFKFHAVLVVNSCHLASQSSPDSQRWLPLLWAVDYFKSSQARDVREGNWTMSAIDESRVPRGEKARLAFIDAMDSWDEEAVDRATTGLVRSYPANEVFELFAHYSCRDFRSIGHKAIYVANAYRTLQCIGWRFAEPVMRSLSYALLNHVGQPNPASSELAADQPWRDNGPLAEKFSSDWFAGKSDESATIELLKTLRDGSPRDAAEQVATLSQSGFGAQTMFDALFLGAGELLMRQPGIVGLHTLTTTNAIHFLFRTCRDNHTRRMLVLQNASFLPMFRSEMHSRGDVGTLCVDELTGEASDAAADEQLTGIFDAVGNDSDTAARRVMGLLSQGDAAKPIIDEARRLTFLKGSDSHDYKFSSAVLEDYFHISPSLRDRYLAASVFQLRGAGERDLPLVGRIRSALNR